MGKSRCISFKQQRAVLAAEPERRLQRKSHVLFPALFRDEVEITPLVELWCGRFRLFEVRLKEVGGRRNDTVLHGKHCNDGFETARGPEGVAEIGL
jgi:hypothetical protein